MHARARVDARDAPRLAAHDALARDVLVHAHVPAVSFRAIQLEKLSAAPRVGLAVHVDPTSSTARATSAFFAAPARRS